MKKSAVAGVRTIALGVTSSVSIYKACEILRGFQIKGHRVRVVMTANAARLVSPLLFGALSGEDAIVDPARAVAWVLIAEGDALLSDASPWSTEGEDA